MNITFDEFNFFPEVRILFKRCFISFKSLKAFQSIITDILSFLMLAFSKIILSKESKSKDILRVKLKGFLDKSLDILFRFLVLMMARYL